MITKDEKAAFSKRLNMLFDRVGVPDKGFGRQLVVAKLFSVSQKGARKWLEGEAVPKHQRICEIVDKYKNEGVTGEWLEYGNQDFAPEWAISGISGSTYLDDVKITENSLNPLELSVTIDSPIKNDNDNGGDSVLLEMVTRQCNIKDPNLVGILTILISSSDLPQEAVAVMLKKRIEEYLASTQIKEDIQAEINEHKSKLKV